MGGKKDNPEAKFKNKRRVDRVSVISERINSREQRLAKARALSKKITNATSTAGITHQELLQNTLKAFSKIKRERCNKR